MTAQLATTNDHMVAGVEEVGVIRDGRLIPRSISDRPQVSGMRFDGGYLSPYFVTDPERMEGALDND